MQKLVQGLHQFLSHQFSSQRELFERLATGQSPDALFITCSDSRINPNLITQTDPGELFILRNAGNIVPPYGEANGGEAATIEYAINALKVKDIIICGHSHCGAMKGLINTEALLELPATAAWLRHAEATWNILIDKYRDRTGEALLEATVEENVLVQLENLRTHPSVQAAIDAGKLKLHGWVYTIETGTVFAYDPKEEQFLTVAEAPQGPAVPGTHLTDAHAI